MAKQKPRYSINEKSWRVMWRNSRSTSSSHFSWADGSLIIIKVVVEDRSQAIQTMHFLTYKSLKIHISSSKTSGLVSTSPSWRVWSVASPRTGTSSGRPTRTRTRAPGRRGSASGRWPPQMPRGAPRCRPAATGVAGKRSIGAWRSWWRSWRWRRWRSRTWRMFGRDDKSAKIAIGDTEHHWTAKNGWT